MNEKTKLLKYVEKNNIRLVDIFKQTMHAKGETVSYRTIFNMAHGYHEPLLKNMKAVAKALNVELDEIF